MWRMLVIALLSASATLGPFAGGSQAAVALYRAPSDKVAWRGKPASTAVQSGLTPATRQMEEIQVTLGVGFLDTTTLAATASDGLGDALCYSCRPMSNAAIFIMWNRVAVPHGVWIDHHLLCTMLPGEACVITDILPGTHVVEYSTGNVTSAVQPAEFAVGSVCTICYPSAVIDDACTRWLSIAPPFEIRHWSLPPNVNAIMVAMPRSTAPLDVNFVSKADTVHPGDVLTFVVRTQPHAACMLGGFRAGQLDGPQPSGDGIADDSGAITWTYKAGSGLGTTVARVECTLRAASGAVEASFNVEAPVGLKRLTGEGIPAGGRSPFNDSDETKIHGVETTGLIGRAGAI